MNCFVFYTFSSFLMRCKCFLLLHDKNPARYKELKKENENLKTELESIEAAKDESQAKCDDFEARLEESEEKVAELQKLADQARALKDEVDILRETSEKVGKYEGIIETYKKKMEEMGDLKRQIKYLEEKNSEYINNNMDLEEELGKVSKKKPQTDLFRKQVSCLKIDITHKILKISLGL